MANDVDQGVCVTALGILGDPITEALDVVFLEQGDCSFAKDGFDLFQLSINACVGAEFVHATLGKCDKGPQE